jgi:HTH-type transcriptional regulator/antitoxin HigA
MLKRFKIYDMNTITTEQEYTTAMQRSEELIAKATAAGGFQNLPKDEVTEFGNIAAAASKYETEVLKLYPFRNKNDIVVQLEEEMFRRRMKRREMASFLGISNSRFSGILHRKSAINIQIAKSLHTKLGFDGNVLLENI